MISVATHFESALQLDSIGLYEYPGGDAPEIHRSVAGVI